MARFFFIFHALSFDLNFFFDRRCPLMSELCRAGRWEQIMTTDVSLLFGGVKCNGMKEKRSLFLSMEVASYHFRSGGSNRHHMCTAHAS